MVLRQILVSVGALFVAISVHGSSAEALSMKECSAKYKAAKEAGTLGGMKWNDFRKAQCGAEETSEPTPSGAPSPPTAQPPKATAVRPSPAPVAVGNAVFPALFTRVSPQARHECKLAWTSTVRTKQPGQTVV